MTEPVPERGESWEELLSRKLMDKMHVELAMATAQPWEMMELEEWIRTLSFEIDVAKRHVDGEGPEIDW